MIYLGEKTSGYFDYCFLRGLTQMKRKQVMCIRTVRKRNKRKLRNLQGCFSLTQRPKRATWLWHFFWVQCWWLLLLPSTVLSSCSSCGSSGPRCGWWHCAKSSSSFSSFQLLKFLLPIPYIIAVTYII